MTPPKQSLKQSLKQPPTSASADTAYVRARDLPRLVALWPDEITDLGIDGTMLLVEKIRATLRRERMRGKAGHWSYDLNRHRALLGCYRAEVRRLAALRLAARVTGDAFVAPRPRDMRPPDVPSTPAAPGSEPHLLGEL